MPKSMSLPLDHAGLTDRVLSAVATSAGHSVYAFRHHLLKRFGEHVLLGELDSGDMLDRQAQAEVLQQLVLDTKRDYVIVIEVGRVSPDADRKACKGTKQPASITQQQAAAVPVCDITRTNLFREGHSVKLQEVQFSLGGDAGASVPVQGEDLPIVRFVRDAAGGRVPAAVLDGLCSEWQEQHEQGTLGFVLVFAAADRVARSAEQMEKVACLAADSPHPVGLLLQTTGPSESGLEAAVTQFRSPEPARRIAVVTELNKRILGGKSLPVDGALARYTMLLLTVLDKRTK